MERDFSSVKRIVIKVGTNILTKGSSVDIEFIDSISSQMHKMMELGYQVLLVSSGAIGMGAKELGILHPITDIHMRQACAAIGQPLLMHAYREAFKSRNLIISQVLLTSEVLNNRHSFLNLRNALDSLLELKSVPIINENDCVSTSEIGNAFGDNDRLSAYIASKIEAELLILLTDIDAMYTKNPNKFPDAVQIETVREITEELENAAGSNGSVFSTGGMKTKLAAVKIAGKAGCDVIIADGRSENILIDIVSGKKVGTHFVSGKKISSRRRWIQNCQVKGKIIIDEGALAALNRRKSLLPKGVISIEGDFSEGDVVSVNDEYKIVSSFSTSELQKIMGKHSGAIRDLLGADRRDVIAPPEDIVEFPS